MKRLFAEHRVRNTHTLDGFWDFALDHDSVGVKETWHRNFPDVAEKMPVPGCWDAIPEYFEYDGRAYYRKVINTAETANVVFTFEGVSGIGTVYLDGRRIGRHNGSYTPFRVLARRLKPGRHELIVLVDNFRYPRMVVPQYGDWFLYGGIFRSVEMATLADIWIKKLHVHYKINGKKVAIEPEITVANLSDRSISDQLTFEINGDVVMAVDVSLVKKEEKTIRLSPRALKLSLWSPESPNLHICRVEFCGDDLSDRVGFRTIKTKDGKICINGIPYKLLGINRHHTYGDNGFAVPQDMVYRDFRIIKDLGCNAVRCHYPVDSFAMDLCDELGLLYWAEIPMYGRWAGVVDQQPYLSLAGKALEEMIDRDFNRPSVFVWSVLNECATDVKAGVTAVDYLVKIARSLDQTRPVSYATNRGVKDLGLGHLDLLALNNYPDWYDVCKGNDWPEFIKKMRRKMKKEKLADLPILITETGGGGVYNDRNLDQHKWTENRQAEIIRRSLEYALNADDIAGIFIWQFADIPVNEAGWERRPKTHNNKGVVDTYRHPKFAYYVLKEFFAGFQQKGYRNGP